VNEDLSLNGRLLVSGDASFGGNLWVGGTNGITTNGTLTVQTGGQNVQGLAYSDTTNAGNAFRLVGNTSPGGYNNLSQTSDIGLFYGKSVTTCGLVIAPQNGAGGVRMSSSGNVGIGIVNPQYNLDVNGIGNFSTASNTTLFVRADATGTYASDNGQLLITGKTNTNLRLGMMVDTTQNVCKIQGGEFLVGALPLVLNSAGGNVGIGTTNVTKLLTVAGDALINGLTVGRGTSVYVDNTAFGISALNANTSQKNTAFGYFALESNIGGDANTAIGENALQANTTGYRNTAVGATTLKMNTGGHWNTAVGSFALRDNATGSCNTALGATAGYQTNTAGSNNTYLGYNANASANNLSNSTAIGANATITASNQIVLGTASEKVVIPNQIQYSYTSVPTLTSTSIGYTINGTRSAVTQITSSPQTIQSLDIPGAGVWLITGGILTYGASLSGYNNEFCCFLYNGATLIRTGKAVLSSNSISVCSVAITYVLSTNTAVTLYLKSQISYGTGNLGGTDEVHLTATRIA
jgi:hypothetical protein